MSWPPRSIMNPCVSIDSIINALLGFILLMLWTPETSNVIGTSEFVVLAIMKVIVFPLIDYTFRPLISTVSGRKVSLGNVTTSVPFVGILCSALSENL
jgi:hypothetical protein